MSERLQVLTDWDWDYMRFKWQDKIYETNLSKAEFFQLCKSCYITGYDLIKKILDEGVREIKIKNSPKILIEVIDDVENL